jgi:hypothetical protein
VIAKLSGFYFVFSILAAFAVSNGMKAENESVAVSMREIWREVTAIP